MNLNDFFAKRILKEEYTEERFRFLSKLMEISRQGDLCWETTNAPAFPDSIVETGNELIAKAPVVRHGNRYYLQRNWVYETHILSQVKRLRGVHFNLETPSLPDSLLPTQKYAIEQAIQNAFSIICGGPGTGKTYTASALIRCLAAQSKGRYRVALAAPTGKAASHLQAVLGSIEAEVEATTLHRLLRVQPGETKLFSNRKIDADLVVVDESSMIDVPLLAQLLEAISDETRLVLLGDPNQLPPIEAGSLFAEMAALYGSFLSRSMRTESLPLLQLAEAVNRGEWIDTDSLLDWPFDSTLIQKLYASANPLISSDEPNPADVLKRLSEFRILGALRQGPFGIDALNQQIIHEMDLRIQPGQWWAIPILITTNRPSQDLYNGTCGALIGKSSGGIQFREATAYFPTPIPYRMLPPFEPSFCLSVHKSQGSEFERVLALFPQGSENFGREALYTAITRGKKEVKIVAEQNTLSGMLSQRSIKYSGFTDRQKSKPHSILSFFEK